MYLCQHVVLGILSPAQVYMQAGLNSKLPFQIESSFTDSKMAAVPPSFGDLGKSARDLFDKDFGM